MSAYDFFVDPALDYDAERAAAEDHDHATWSRAMYDEWLAGRQVYLADLPLSFCGSQLQRDGWLSLCDPQQRADAVAELYTPDIYTDDMEIPV